MIHLFAGCAVAVVTADAVAGRRGVVEVCRQPASGGMADLALGSGHDMVGGFSGRGAAVVAAAAAS